MEGLQVIESKEDFNPLSLMPQTFQGKLEAAKIICSSGLVPQGLNTPEKVCVALEWGHELQLSPMVAVNNIAVVNGKPSLSADIMSAIAKKSPSYGGIKWVRQDDQVAECVVTRKGADYKEEVKGYYDIKMAQTAGLTNKDNWKKYPARMLKHRALSFALRDAFPDMLAGIYNPDELSDVVDSYPKEEPLRNVTPKTEWANAEQTREINSIIKSTYEDGTPVFTSDDYEHLSEMKAVMLAEDVLEYLEKELKKRLEAKKQG